ncbi:hypothetical protein QJS04_geneDACA005564 [Acorus gramineus]|uniref:Uncharacterized protein n=1 Tax=Acorus gramineus TaxID=55184 RepID=A0AAV9A6X5_ACOGR|nr:hypothetical protein QJS04_geneDACA005564 [Acorus gramineus]
MAAEVTFQCKRTVVSTKPVQPGKFIHPSVLDRTVESNILHLIFYYHFPPPAAPGELTRKLRESLSTVLTAYPAVTGRLQRDSEGHWMIKCNDAGVRMVEATAKGSVEEWLSCVDREEELRLVHWEDMFQNPCFWSTFYVQLTEFEGGGLAIGLSCTHLLADVACATMLVRAWADTTFLGKMLCPPYFHALPPRRITDSQDSATGRRESSDALIEHYKSAIDNIVTPSEANGRFATLAFGFDDESIRRCTAHQAQWAMTPFEVLAGLFWVCVGRARGKPTGPEEMLVCVDSRDPLGLHRGFFGNAMVFSPARCNGPMTVEAASKAVHEAAGRVGREAVVDLVEWLTSNGCDPGCGPPVFYGPGLVCADWAGLGWYGAVFEAGKRPARVSCYIGPVIGEGQILILPSPERGDVSMGRVVMVTLPKNQASRLCEEPLLLSYSPTLIMGVQGNS